jgi:ribonucleoside-diphosphate reductase beta chain
VAGLPAIDKLDVHPLPWLAPLFNGVEHTNFFETRATEYSKAATRGNWQDVWSSFDQRRKAKGSAANEVGEAEGPGLFGDEGAGAQGVAAE